MGEPASNWWTPWAGRAATTPLLPPAPAATLCFVAFAAASVSLLRLRATRRRPAWTIRSASRTRAVRDGVRDQDDVPETLRAVLSRAQRQGLGPLAVVKIEGVALGTTFSSFPRGAPGDEAKGGEIPRSAAIARMWLSAARKRLSHRRTRPRHPP